MKVPRLYLVLFFLGVLLDQVVKAWARGTFMQGQAGGAPWPGVFEFTLVYNKGIAFGMLPGGGILFAPVALLITGMTFRFCLMHPQESRLTHVAMGLLGAGAIGNLIDRLILKHVTDMFWFRAINFPVFNVADAFITIGAILFGLRFVFESKFAPEATKEPASSEL
ncbi:MAG: signal peptidase II [Armatimonadetes bacterium]|nr:signal peptidase II [Armatimonadota bacterium]